MRRYCGYQVPLAVSTLLRNERYGDRLTCRSNCHDIARIQEKRPNQESLNHLPKDEERAVKACPVSDE